MFGHLFLQKKRIVLHVVRFLFSKGFDLFTFLMVVDTFFDFSFLHFTVAFTFTSTYTQCV